MKLILVDLRDQLCARWEEQFADLPDVQVVQGYFESVDHYDCMVSPANSFGLMDGGIDAAITRYFGESLMQRVQQRIIEDYCGEQPVGTSIIVETGHEKHSFLAHTPTMRVPMTIAHTDNVYKAMWAMLLAVRQHNRVDEHKIDTVLCPGLGTATGQVPYQEAACQMALAYRNFLNPPERIDWNYATVRQLEIRYGGDDGLNFPPRT